MQPATPPSGTVRLLTPSQDAPEPRSEVGRQARQVVQVTIDDHDRTTRRVVEALEGLAGDGVAVEVRDAREDPAAADALERLVCCGPVTPVVEVGGLLLTAPTPAEAILAVRRVLPGAH